MAITTKPRGNLSKAVVLELVKDATPEQVATLFTGKDNKPCTLVSRKRAVEVLSLTGAKKKAVEEYTYPAKRKPRKAILKRGTDSNTVNKDNYKSKLKAMEEQLAERLK